MNDLERAVWTLMCTDDYSIVSQTANAATLVYVHNGARITLTATEPTH
jgi:hypothetical protein